MSTLKDYVIFLYNPTLQIRTSYFLKDIESDPWAKNNIFQLVTTLLQEFPNYLFIELQRSGVMNEMLADKKGEIVDFALLFKQAHKLFYDFKNANTDNEEPSLSLLMALKKLEHCKDGTVWHFITRMIIYCDTLFEDIKTR